MKPSFFENDCCDQKTDQTGSSNVNQCEDRNITGYLVLRPYTGEWHSSIV
jgi:hypothetical protein